MKKQLLVGILLVTSITALEAKQVSIVAGLTKAQNKLINTVVPAADNYAKKKIPKTKFINTLVSAAYAFTADYIAVMHSQPSVKVEAHNTINHGKQAAH